MRISILLALGIGCGDNARIPTTTRPDAEVHDSMLVDTQPVDTAQWVRVFGNVDFNGGLRDVVVSVVGGPDPVVRDVNGDFFIDAPEGSRLILEARATNRPELYPMIRGVIARDHLRPRVFYLLGPADVSTAATLGLTFDPAKAIVEVDFRNAEIGGYGASLGVTPGFGIAYDSNGDAVSSLITVAGGGGSTLLLGDLVPGDATFAPILPSAATLPCDPRDANPLPLVAGSVTWFDYECGMGTD